MRTHSALAASLATAALLLRGPVATAAVQEAAPPPPRAIQLEVDAREAPRHVFHARLVIPATPRPLTVVCPKWVAGEHIPSGPIADLTGLCFRAAGRTLDWQRDAVDLLAFHMVVPAGADAVEAQLDYLAPSGGGSSVSLVLSPEGAVLDVIPGSAADVAGLAPGDTLLAVGGRRHSTEKLREAIKVSHTTHGVDLVVANGDFVGTRHVEYDGGARYPRLDPVAGQADLLAEIIRPRAGGTPKPAP